jgi:hypothetical protein
MNPNNDLYKYAEQLNEYGSKLVKQFMQSKEYADLHLKIAKIDADIWKAEQEYRKKIRELRTAKRNIEINEIPKAKAEYVRNNIESYKMHLRIKDADNHISAYME